MPFYHLPLTALSLSALTLLAACGGGGTGGTNAGSNVVTAGTSSTLNVPSSGEANQTVAIGRFVDSAVEGLSFQTATQAGTTNDTGAFSYLPGEDIVFSIGSIELPAIEAVELVTPLTVFSTENMGDTRVINLSRLLQTLDVDSNPDNGITLSESAAASATGLDVDFASPTFDASVGNLVANSGSSTTQLIDGETALTHLQETLFNEGVMERPQAPTNTVTDSGPSGASATHSLVGTVRQFTTRSHNVSGTMTIVDDRTIEVSNFVYDGLGPSVFFYTGVDGDYSSSGGGRIIGEMLNGRSFNGETVTLTLPEDLTLDDFNGLSVWCDIFFVSFGDVEF